MAKNDSSQSGIKVVALNRKARFEYQILETFEAGIVLTGSEIKSIRAGQISLGESYIRADGNEMFLLQAHIAQYDFDTNKEYDALRKRKLLMHKLEIERLSEKVQQKGLTIVPLQIYLKRGKAKIEIALAKGKDNPDKRNTIKERVLDREAARAMKARKNF